MATVEKSIDVGVPVSTAYGQWTQFEEFPQFMEGVLSVSQIDDSHMRWVAEVGGERKEWEAEIVEQEPDRVIAWRSKGGLHNHGRVEFMPTNDGTRVSVSMEYEPQGIKESAGALLGFDGGQVEDDLERFKELIENREVPTGSWRGEIRSGEVVEDDSPR
ncbi:MAG TPA: SRPBCC family protein [Gaiellaceae bacterium]|nr:SRPBCC family protein [Gaiellaceae bacterium]